MRLSSLRELVPGVCICAECTAGERRSTATVVALMACCLAQGVMHSQRARGVKDGLSPLRAPSNMSVSLLCNRDMAGAAVPMLGSVGIGTYHCTAGFLKCRCNRSVSCQTRETHIISYCCSSGTGTGTSGASRALRYRAHSFHCCMRYSKPYTRRAPFARASVFFAILSGPR